MVSISFKHKEENIKISNDNSVEVFKDVCDWLYKNGYDFKSDRISSRKVYTKEEIVENDLPIGRFHRLPNSMYIPTTMTGNISIRLRNLITMLTKFGVKESTIKTEGFDTKSRIKKFNEIEEDDSETIETSKPLTNPFNQAILVLGESGAGKSYTIENILESSNHNYQFIIPTAATTGLLAQYSPSKSAYVPSRLGKMLIEASNNPSDLYTAVFDECHKSNVIEMINDELLQAISLRRNRYRFISLDDDTAEVFEDSNLEVERGNIKIPDNFGFIFISSNPRVIGGNPDFFNRVDLIEVTEADRKINNIEELLSKKVEESSDKRELIDKLRSK
jgi:hypothetical protein